MTNFSRASIIIVAFVIIVATLLAIVQRWGPRRDRPLQWIILFMAIMTFFYRIWVAAVASHITDFERTFIIITNNFLLSLWMLIIGGLILRSMWVYTKVG